MQFKSHLLTLIEKIVLMIACYYCFTVSGGPITWGSHIPLCLIHRLRLNQWLRMNLYLSILLLELRDGNIKI